MIWSDTFINAAFGNYFMLGNETCDPAIAEMIPSDVRLVYWDYVHDKEEEYVQHIARHQTFPNEVVFAGGAWKWQSFAPAIQSILELSRPALKACVKRGIKDAFVTAWGDCGNDASLFSVLPVLQLYAEYGYSDGEVDDALLDEQLFACTGERLANMKLLSLPDQPSGNLNRPELINPYPNPSKYLLYQDILTGLFDRHVGAEFAGNYAEYTQKLTAAGNESSSFAYVYRTLAALCDALTLKCDLGVRLKKAYDGGDKAEVQKITEEFPTLLYRVEQLHKCMETQWFTENKPFGYEVQDIRFGALESRIKTVERRLHAWLSGEIDRIEELEQERLHYNFRLPMDPDISEYRWPEIVTGCII